MNNINFKELAEEAKNVGVDRFVVAGIILNDSKVLILERPKDDFMGGIYELPSGKVESGEDLHIALHREIEEETNCKIKDIKEYLGNFEYMSKSGKRTRQFNFLISIKEPVEIKLTEHDNFAWVEKENLFEFPVTDSVKKVLDFDWN